MNIQTALNVQEHKLLNLWAQFKLGLAKKLMESVGVNPEPLVYTIHGNVPSDGLRREVKWELSADPVTNQLVQVIHAEEYYDRMTGEMVKRGADVYLLRGASTQSEQGQIG